MLSLPIGCMKFLFPKLLVTPLLAWANTPIIDWGYLLDTYVTMFNFFFFPNPTYYQTEVYRDASIH